MNNHIKLMSSNGAGDTSADSETECITRTVQNGREIFPRVANSGLARMSVASPSQIGRKSLGTDVSQSQVTLEISPDRQLLPSHIGGT